MSRKIRSDCRPITELTDEEQQELFGWVKTMGFEKARLLAIKEYAKKFSIGSLHTAFHHWSSAESENRIFQAVTGADTILDAAGDHLGKLDAAMEAALKTATFEAIMAGADPKTIKSFSDILLKSRSMEIDERKVALLEKKAQQAEEAEAAAKDETLSPEQQAERMKQIFGL